MNLGEMYRPLIEYAKNDDEEGLKYLIMVGELIFTENECCPNIEDGIKAASKNLDYYCQYFNDKIKIKVKDFYCLGQGFRGLNGVKAIGY